jgi:hypothetical protein
VHGRRLIGAVPGKYLELQTSEQLVLEGQGYESVESNFGKVAVLMGRP